VPPRSPRDDFIMSYRSGRRTPPPAPSLLPLPLHPRGAIITRFGPHFSASAWPTQPRGGGLNYKGTARHTHTHTHTQREREREREREGEGGGGSSRARIVVTSRGITLQIRSGGADGPGQSKRDRKRGREAGRGGEGSAVGRKHGCIIAVVKGTQSRAQVSSFRAARNSRESR